MLNTKSVLINKFHTFRPYNTNECFVAQPQTNQMTNE